MSTKDSAHDFIVKFSPSVCVAVVASSNGEMAARSFAYHAHGTADSHKSSCYPWFVCHDKTAMHAHSGLPPMINQLTSSIIWRGSQTSHTFTGRGRVWSWCNH